MCRSLIIPFLFKLINTSFCICQHKTPNVLPSFAKRASVSLGLRGHSPMTQFPPDFGIGKSFSLSGAGGGPSKERGSWHWHWKGYLPTGPCWLHCSWEQEQALCCPCIADGHLCTQWRGTAASCVRPLLPSQLCWVSRIPSRAGSFPLKSHSQDLCLETLPVASHISHAGARGRGGRRDTPVLFSPPPSTSILCL